MSKNYADTSENTTDNAEKDAGKQKDKTFKRRDYINRKTRQAYDEKKRIAAHIVDNYINDFDSVMLDAGSTIELIAEEMFKKKKYLSVLTNSMAVYAAYYEAYGKNPLMGNKLHITGGNYVDEYESLLGEGAKKSVNDFCFNVVIIGTSGLSGVRVDGGIFCHGADEKPVKETLLRKPTETRLIVANWEKFGKSDTCSFGVIEQIKGGGVANAVIVTSKPPDNINNTQRGTYEKEVFEMKDLGIQVIEV